MIIICPLLSRVVVTLDLKTRADNGVIMYFEGYGGLDFIGMTMQNGMLRYAFDNGGGSAIILSDKKLNDGKWHTVSGEIMLFT